MDFDSKIDNINLYLQLLEFENSGNCVPNILEFDCPVCFLQIPPGQGIILRDCLHHFCKDCLENTILNCNDSEVRCPFIDDNYNCESMLQEREIRGILTEEKYEKHLMKSLRQAEQKIENTFHCKQPDCDWFCVVDPGITEIKCEICKIVYCIQCQVSHDGFNCRQFKESLEGGSTEKILQDMIDNKEAMVCSTCKAMVTKVDGCDGLTCTICKTQLCWATKGPRWGPKGKGDTSGGCKCNFLMGIRCSPNCKNCH